MKTRRHTAVLALSDTSLIHGPLAARVEASRDPRTHRLRVLCSVSYSKLRRSTVCCVYKIKATVARSRI